MARVDLSGMVTSGASGLHDSDRSAEPPHRPGACDGRRRLPVLSITKSHSGNFAQGQQGAAYTLVVSNTANAAPTAGTVTVTDVAPAGLTVVSMTGDGWQCGTNSCSRTDSLAAGASYPAVDVRVNVTTTATSPQVNAVTVSGGGSAAAAATDSTVIVANAPALTITKTHVGDFTQEQDGVYTIVVSNAVGAGATSGVVTVSDTLPWDSSTSRRLGPDGNADPRRVAFEVTRSRAARAIHRSPSRSPPCRTPVLRRSTPSPFRAEGPRPRAKRSDDGGCGDDDAREVDPISFSVLNLAGATGGEPIVFEANAQPFSVLNLGGTSQPTAAGGQRRPVLGAELGDGGNHRIGLRGQSGAVLGAEPGSGVATGSVFEVGPTPFSVLNLATGESSRVYVRDRARSVLSAQSCDWRDSVGERGECAVVLGGESGVRRHFRPARSLQSPGCRRLVRPWLSFPRST